MTKVLVCPIAFNEHVKIKRTIERFIASPAFGKVEYLVMDDGSTDETTKIIESFSNQGVQTIKHAHRIGVGAAIRTAINHAIKKNFDIIVIMAGNDKDDPNEIFSLVDPVIKEDFDFVQGSRYKGGCGVGGDMPMYRRIATRLHPALLSFFTKKRVTDSTNGFRAIKLSVFKDKRINLDQQWLNAYELEPYILFKVLIFDYKFKEVLVKKVYPSRKLGYTKMRPFLGWWSILKPILYLGFRIKK
ncbi:MAG: glycosyltransferase family 2 protein [Candidatus Omnitrophica bacterium]|nr:glycosyltransferase family 2 protein [Candidatus Omnitrophota bacterium]